MSAIFGILRFDGGDVSARDLERMSNALAHRGPDGRKFVADGPVGIGHCLLRVNHEDLFEAQPLRDRESGLTLAADCRIDNREELAGHFGIGAEELRGLPDSALVLHAYKKWGENCAEHLLGDFAFALWDARARRLVLARDHMGQRYVHYHHGKGFFVFATEVKALWAYPDVPRNPDDVQVGRSILMDFRPQEGATVFAGIRGLTGGSTITVGVDGAQATRRYWEPQGSPEHEGRDEAYYIETYRRVFTEAVACRVRRLAVQPALSLSGGYDSAAIAELAAPFLRAQGRKLIAVSSVMAEGYRGPARCARHWVDVCRRAMPHLDVHYFVRRDETLFTDIERATAASDGVPAAAHYVIDGLYREAAGAGARLMIDGLGGDGALNPRGGGALLYFLRSGQLRRFMKEFAAHRRMTGRSTWAIWRDDIAARLVPGRAWGFLRDLRRGFVPRWSESFIAPQLARAMLKDGTLDLSALLSTPRSWPGLRAQSFIPLRFVQSMARPHNNAGQAAAFGMDLTRPLLDKRVIEFGLSVPEDLYVKNGRNRYLACAALADVLPAEFQSRGRQQDVIWPDRDDMLKDALPRLRAEVDALAKDRALQEFIDFPRLTRALTQVAGEQVRPRELILALRAFETARYVAWLRGRNR